MQHARPIAGGDATAESIGRFASRIAAKLDGDAVQLNEHWESRARALTPGATQPPTAKADNLEIVRAVISSLTDAPSWHASIARSGWAFGAAAHRSELSLHIALRHASLLGDLLLHAAELSMAEVAGELAIEGVDSGAVCARAGVSVARRLHRAVGLLGAVAAQGFTHAHLGTLQERYRTIRHDLRNPLGTIRNAVGLMEDESVPLEVRVNPRYRTIIKRGVSTIETMIRQTLDDASVLATALDWHVVSLSAIASAVRREMRDEVTRAQCDIVVDEAMPVVMTDPAVFELALEGVLSALVRHARPGSTLRVTHEQSTEMSAIIVIELTPDHGPSSAILTPETCEFARSLLSDIGGLLSIGAEVRIEMPVLARESDAGGAAHSSDGRGEAERPVG